ncbi:GATAD2A family protein [Megaselia abdita]
MAKMDVDDVVDLSLGSGRDLTITPSAAVASSVPNLRALTQNSGLTITPTPAPTPPQVTTAPPTPTTPTATTPSSTTATTPTTNNFDTDDGKVTRRVLRPRTEPKSYAETPDIVLLPARVNGGRQNGNIDSETDDEEMPLSIPIKELTPSELKEREKELRKLREDLRNEETKLVLLKKLKQSQHIMKENLIVTPSNNVVVSPTNPLASISVSLAKGSLSVTPTSALPLPAHSRIQRSSNNLSNSNSRNQTTFSKSNSSSSSGLPPPRSSLPGGATLTAGGSSSLRNSNIMPRTGSNLTITPSVTITPTTAPPSGMKPRNVPQSISNSVSITPAPPLLHQNDSKNDRSTPRGDTQSPAERQAAAKMALRKQLEKTLLQIPPPKPPPPEMHFIPNPSNTEFVYLLGLETVVDYIMTKDKRPPPVLPPFRCAQCKTDFTPVWKWEKQGKRRKTDDDQPPSPSLSTGNKDPKVICEQCVTTNVKKALKAEHTNRLKQAFVKALQQEQEIEQRLAAQSSPSPVDSHPSHSSTPTISASSQQQQQHQQSHQQQQQQPPQLQTTILPSKSQTPTPSATPTPRPTPPPSQQVQSHHTPPPSASSASSSRSSRHHQQQQQQHSDSSGANPSHVASAAAAAAAAAAQLNALSNLPGLGNIAGLNNLGNLANLSNLAGAAGLNNLGGLGAMQALQQQLMRALGSLQTGNVNPQHLMQFTPLLYSYQLAMLQASQMAQSAGNKNQPSIADIQRAAELQRQYLLEMMPSQTPGSNNNRQNNWKT